MKNKIKIGLFLIALVGLGLYINNSYSYKEKGIDDSSSYIVNVKESYNKYFWKYKNEITKIIFDKKYNQDKYEEKWDISTKKDNSIVAYLVEENSRKVVYIIGEEIQANSDSSYLFANFTNLEEIKNLNYLDTSEVVSMAHMFDSCSMLKKVDLSNLNTSKVTDMSSLFASDINLLEINMDNLDTSNVLSFEKMFFECSSIENLDLEHLNTTKLKNMSSMFKYASNLKEIKINNIETKNVTDMSFMFANCESLLSLDLSNFNTAKVTDMRGMFANCLELESLDLSSFDFKNVKMAGYAKETIIPTYMEYGMFYNSPKINTIMTINNSNMDSLYMFDASQNVILNYTKAGETLVDKIVSSKINVKKGMLVNE